MKLMQQLLIPVIAFTCYACNNNNSTSTKEQPKAEEAVVEGKYAKNTGSNCVAPSIWFKTVDGNRMTSPPNEGPTSPFANNATVTNCDFHQWSWQKFLWLTNDINGKPLFLDQLIQVDANGNRTPTDKGIELTAIDQASSTSTYSDILKTPFDPSHTVYYSIFLDDSFYSTMQKYAPIAKTNPAAVKDVTFPVGALELKASWIDASALKNPDDYFITSGVINNVQIPVALLGIHVVGVVENHPEFVWATFEHENLAPKYDWSKATATSDAPVTSSVDYPFFSKGTTATIDNITSGNGSYTNVFSVYEYGTPVQKNAANQKVFMKTSQDGEENFNHINEINKSVKGQLSGVWNNYFYNGSIWIDTEGYNTTQQQAELLNSKSYHLSDSKPGDLTRGSVAEYNITMETYVQVSFDNLPNPMPIHQQNAGNLVNCFSCHNASGNNNNLSPLYLSHVFTRHINHLEGLNNKEIRAVHSKEIIAQFLKRTEANKK